jgi:hypothetical protein
VKAGVKHEYGVASVVKTEVINYVLDFKAISERICSIGIKTK